MSALLWAGDYPVMIPDCDNPLSIKVSGRTRPARLNDESAALCRIDISFHFSNLTSITFGFLRTVADPLKRWSQVRAQLSEDVSFSMENNYLRPMVT